MRTHLCLTWLYKLVTVSCYDNSDGTLNCPSFIALPGYSGTLLANISDLLIPFLLFIFRVICWFLAEWKIPISPRVTNNLPPGLFIYLFISFSPVYQQHYNLSLLVKLPQLQQWQNNKKELLNKIWPNTVKEPYITNCLSVSATYFSERSQFYSLYLIDGY